MIAFCAANAHAYVAQMSQRRCTNDSWHTLALMAAWRITSIWCDNISDPVSNLQEDFRLVIVLRLLLFSLLYLWLERNHRERTALCMGDSISHRSTLLAAKTTFCLNKLVVLMHYVTMAVTKHGCRPWVRQDRNSREKRKNELYFFFLHVYVQKKVKKHDSGSHLIWNSAIFLPEIVFFTFFLCIRIKWIAIFVPKKTWE